MLKLNQKQNRQPFGGHHYAECGITFRGDTKDQVVEKLTAFRLANHMKVGNPDQDVLMFYAKNWPWLVCEDKSEDSVEIQDSTEQQYIKWRTWVQEVWSKPSNKLITPKEASLRWEVCAKCPFNIRKEWRETKESSDTARQVFLMRRGVPVPEHLGYCALHGTDLSLFTFLDNPEAYSRMEKKDQGVKCWVTFFGGAQ